MTDTPVPSGAELAAAIDALPEGRRTQLARRIAQHDQVKPEVLSAKAVAAAYELLDEQGQTTISERITEVAKRSKQRAERQGARESAAGQRSHHV